MDYIGVGVGAVILNKQNEIFLARRGQHAKNEPGTWETPGGALEFGETLEKGTRRELKEEFGVELELIEAWPMEDHILPEERQHWVAATFLARVKLGCTPRILEPEKFDDIGWFALDALPTPLSQITQKNIARLLRSVVST